MAKQLIAKHGIVYREPKSFFGYFGWPTVTRQANGTLVVASSGFRHSHLCPWGKTVLFQSRDEGRHWSDPEIINDSPLDDRDAGILALPGGGLLTSWFASDMRVEINNESYSKAWKHVVALYDEKTVRQWEGSWTRYSPDGKKWLPPQPSPVTAPHGPIHLKSGNLLYFGKRRCRWASRTQFTRVQTRDFEHGAIEAAVSKDLGKTWMRLGEVPMPRGIPGENVHEPHVVELPGNKLLGMIRFQDDTKKDRDGDRIFTMLQTESRDGGKTWDEAKPTGVAGSPPHLLFHSRGTLVNVYGYRKKPYGQRAMASPNEGETWQHNLVIRRDGPSGDLGYPSSVELSDGSIFTVYYQPLRRNEPCSILWSKWKLP